MVIELADIAVRAGQEDAFVAAYREAVAQRHASPGFRSVRMTRGCTDVPADGADGPLRGC
jgi:heme-degrading monooxygenase HmoA